MINQLGQVMLYVNDVEKIKSFWIEKVGFVVTKELHDTSVHSIEIAPNFTAQTRFVLFNRNVIEETEPELNFETPSLMFYTNDIDELYQKFQDAGITVGEKVDIQLGTVFNFADTENNYFAVMERK